MRQLKWCLPEREKDRILGEEEKKIVAYHEVGHALVATNLKHAEPVQKITIVPRTMGSTRLCDAGAGGRKNI